MIESMGNVFAFAQQWLFETLLQPLMLWLGLAAVLEVGYIGAAWLLVGLIQMAVIVLVFAPMQRLRPVEAVNDRATIRTDMAYTLIHRLGLFRAVLFLTIDPLFDTFFGFWRGYGMPTLHLDQMLGLEHALASLALYLVVMDLVDYWIHRGQHSLQWWWQLHSLHHAQRQMTVWSDNRNHLVDDLLRDCLLVVVAQVIGVAPAQFIAIVAITQLSESFQHANLRLSFGLVGERLWVSPRFHRLHHAVGIGHESKDHVLGGHNFAVLLPLWDIIFKTANFELRYDRTGVRDQIEQGRDYGRGLWSQQWLGLMRLMGKA